MQKRHTDRKMYFHDLEVTSQEYYIDYVSAYTKLTPESSILEVGCGEGGNLAPFARLGCRVTGVDIAECRIKDAKAYFSEISDTATFACCDFMKCPVPNRDEDKYDVILLHGNRAHSSKRAIFGTHQKLFETDRCVVCWFSCMANAFWRTSADLQKQILLTSTIHSLASQSFI